MKMLLVAGYVSFPGWLQSEDRPILGRRHHDQARHRHRRRHEPQRGVVPPDVQAPARHNLATVLQIVRGDIIGAMADQKLLLVVAIENRRSVGVLAFGARIARSVDFPDVLARRAVDGQHLRAAAMDQLHVQAPVVKHRRARHAELNLEPPIFILHVLLPNLTARNVVARQVTRAKKHPHVLAVGRRRWRGGVSFVSMRGAIALADDLPPNLFTVGRVKRQQDQLRVVNRADKDAVVPNHRRGAGLTGQRSPPGDVFVGAELGRNVLFATDAVEPLPRHWGQFSAKDELAKPNAKAQNETPRAKRGKNIAMADSEAGLGRKASPSVAME